MLNFDVHGLRTDFVANLDKNLQFSKYFLDVIKHKLKANLCN